MIMATALVLLMIPGVGYVAYMPLCIVYEIRKTDRDL
jgi:hypothetical protein